jgi:hypothetical protein
MRKDGKRVKNASPSYLVGAYLMPHRFDAANMTEVDVPLAPISAYIRKKRGEGVRLSHLGVILAAYVRTVAEFPLLNRFFVNKRPYARNEVSVCMVVLKPDSEGTTSKMFFELEDDVFTVQKTLDRFIDGNRVTGDANATDGAARVLTKIPGLLTVGAALFRFLDRYGLLPKSLIDASPFHSSILVSNLASIGTGHIYHHVYSFGTTSIALTIGKTREVPVRHGDTVRFERCLPFGVTMDERICDGAYFAVAFARFKEYLADPTKLEGPSAHPVIREWAAPGDYERLKAKRDYERTLEEIEKSTGTRREKRAAKRAAKLVKKEALKRAKEIKKAHKGEKPACV